MLRIFDRTIAGQLIGFLAVFTAALAVPLTGERAETASGPADFSGRQNEMDEGENGVHAFGMLLDPARRERMGRAACERARSLFDEERLVAALLDAYREATPA